MYFFYSAIVFLLLCYVSFYCYGVATRQINLSKSNDEFKEVLKEGLKIIKEINDPRLDTDLYGKNLADLAFPEIPVDAPLENQLDVLIENSSSFQIQVRHNETIPFFLSKFDENMKRIFFLNFNDNEFRELLSLLNKAQRERLEFLNINTKVKGGDKSGKDQVRQENKT